MAASFAVPVPAAAAEIDSAIVKRHDEGVERLLASQSTDPRSPDYGNVPNPNGLRYPGGASGILSAMMAAFTYDKSRFHGNPLLVERMRLAAGWLERNQHPDGYIDLVETNFDSPPDTAFVIHGVGNAGCLAKRSGNPELFRIVEPFLHKAADGLAVGGIHTPNHRWAVSQALAQLSELFPDPRYVRRIDQWLAEGIDIDEDGQYTERSTSVYNAVSDRAFVVMATKLKRPELLDPVRRNLDSMLYLLHPDYEVVTEISHRQDRNTRAGMGGYWLPLQYLAVKDRNGHYANIADHLAPTYASLATLLEYPEIAGPLPAPVAPPDDYERLMPKLGIVRFRRGTTSATLLSNDPTFFTLRRGGAVIEAVRFASAFFGKGQFRAAALDQAGKTYDLKQHLAAGYYQPLDPPQKVTPANWAMLRGKREETQHCELDQSVSLTETAAGFRLRVRATGTKGVPLAIEINLRDGGTLEGCETLAPDRALLASGHATYTVGTDRIRFGPALAEHRYTQVRGALPKFPGKSVYLTAVTPCDHTIEFELA